MLATSPIAQTAGSAVAQASSTTTPPRSPTSRPQSRASLVAWPDTDGEDHHVDVEGRTLTELHPRDRAAVADDLRRGGGGPDRHTERLDEPLECGATTIVHLQGHEPGRELHDGRLDLQRGECAGGLEAEQAAADDSAANRPVEPQRGASRRTRAGRRRRRWCGRRTPRGGPSRGPGARRHTSRSPGRARRRRGRHRHWS